MSYSDIFRFIKSKVRYGFIVEWYNFWYLIFQKKQKITPQVATIEETINKIISDGCSISRFGDGEILLTHCHSIGFQKGDPELATRLIEVLESNDKKHLVCISDVFKDLYRYNRKARRFWRAHFYLYGELWDKYLSPEKEYYNTFVSRPYMDFASKKECDKWFKEIKRVWNNRDIVFIEGEKSRLGVGNDLFDNANSIKRILCPAYDAFDKYGQIVHEAKKLNKNDLILIALGPTATVLSYDLFKLGFQALDIGHIDIEYEWWRMKAKRKVRIKQKFTNEAFGGNWVTESDKEYEKEIISRIE
ncbi:SP_1767 family glycosyltransferase [Massilibacteroides sp.]|uniref:SP_1767 family glycosyltransferase n=1 Tax=Massilibacteroides sp. TaxID=2034766 RepID=UPI0026316A07|nr:SP_1767 family glycosyltransferase [Massilibacteroides sp.]MDD4514749.1 SP_1767 family glycosyltransferase [Massilibacteroides sp.]